MVSEEFKADLGRAQFIEHQKELTQALQQLANALGKDKAYCYSEDFLNDFMSGLWQPFEEVQGGPKLTCWGQGTEKPWTMPFLLGINAPSAFSCWG